jgi:hypothetical protein
MRDLAPMPRAIVLARVQGWLLAKRLGNGETYGGGYEDELEEMDRDFKAGGEESHECILEMEGN